MVVCLGAMNFGASKEYIKELYEHMVEMSNMLTIMTISYTPHDELVEMFPQSSVEKFGVHGIDGGKYGDDDIVITAM